MTRFLLALLGVFALVPLTAQALEPTTENGIDGRIQVALVGDSYTDGVINDPNIPPGLEREQKLCYLDLCFAAIVEAHLASCNVATARHGAGGTTTRDWDPNDFHEDDAAYQLTGRELFSLIPAANIVVVFLGINDAIGFFEENEPVPPEEYAQHLVDMAWTLRSRGVDAVLLVTAPTPRAWAPPELQASYLAAYAETVRAIAAELDFVGVVDVADAYPINEWDENAIHPTLDGHRVIADLMIAELDLLLAD